MKRFFPALLLLLCFASCQKEITGTPPETPTATGSFTAKIDGVPWVADKFAYVQFSPAAFGIPDLITITGIGFDKKLIVLSLVDSGAHAYSFTEGGLNGGAYQDSSLPNVFVFASNQAPDEPNGNVRITNIDTAKKTVSGTFQFIAYREMDGLQRNITEGVFTDIPYNRGTGIPPASTKDTFTVKIDDALFTPYSITGLQVALTNSITVQASTQGLAKTVGLSFPTDIVAGNYTLDVFGATHSALYLNGATSLASLSGTLQILEHNKASKRVRGNFAFKAEAMGGNATPAELTEGYFSVVYQ
jgi:hypothetical protein